MFSLDTSAPMPQVWRVEQCDPLDQRLFAGPYVLIDRDNGSPQRVSTHAEATVAVRSGTAAAVAGQVRPQVLAADIDPADSGADAEAGEAVADDVVLWAENHGLPWLVRASGRAGGRHVFVAAPAESIASDLAGPWRELCARLGRQHGVSTSPRTTLRLLASPHRSGQASPILGGTLRVSDLPAPVAEPQQATTSHRSRRGPVRRGQSGVDRSAREYGQALARARAGWSLRQAWEAANVAGSKAADQGQTNWRRWVWAPATTVVAAEHGLSEQDAWTQFAQASPRRAEHLGHTGWRSTYWEPAVAEAQQPRPRRRRTGNNGAAESEQQHEADIAAVREGLVAAAEQELDACHRRPQFRRSVLAALHALAPVIVRRAGSISERSWCESARLARDTLRRVLGWLVDRSIVQRTRTYSGGIEDSAAWQPTAGVQSTIDSVTKTQTTRGVHPTTRSYGHADVARMSQRHQRERKEFHLRKELSAATDISKQAYKSSTHRAARALRSLWFQKRWWHRKSEQEREQRRVERRRELGALHRSTRSHWLSWLDRRSELVLTAARLDAGNATADDHARLEQAPRVLYRGLADPQWSDWDRIGVGRAQADRHDQPALLQVS